MLVPGFLTNNFFDDFFGGCDKPERPETHPAFRGGRMKTDIRETDEGYEIDIELPGFKKEDVNAELRNGYLTVSANNSSESEEKDEKGRYLRRERFTGAVSRTYYVGENYTEEDIKARFENGILKLALPKEKEREVRTGTITID